MKTISKMVFVAMIFVLVLAPAASAAVFMYDDFEDGDVSDWTFDTTATYGVPISASADTLRQGTGHSIDAYDFAPNPGKQLRFYDDYDYDARWGSFTKPLANDSLADTVYMSVDLTHAGGYVDGTGGGFKMGMLDFMNSETDMGVRIFYAMTKLDTAGPGQLGVGYTQDGEPYIQDNLIEVEIGVDDDYDQHNIELKYDRIAGIVTFWWEGQLQGQITYAAAENSQIKDFDYVRWTPHKAWVMDNPDPNYDVEIPLTILLDNVYVGDQPIPEPTSAALLAIGSLGLMRRRRK